MDLRNWRSGHQADRASTLGDAHFGARLNYNGTDVANDRDHSLVMMIAAGDETALREIQSRYYQRVACFAWKITRRWDLAEEITNDTLRVIWQCATKFRGASKVSTWILGIAFRLSMTTLRTMRRRWRADSMHDIIEHTHTHEPWVEAEVCEWLSAALARLPEEQRTVLELSYCLGHSCKEIADRMHCPVGTVKTRLFYGRRRLRQLLPRLAGAGIA
jgi:RNA polymerase sigma-70 factor (ECF subfamily)